MTNTPPAEAAAPMIRFCDVNKKYGSYHALVDINAEVARGEVVRGVDAVRTLRS